MNVLTAGWIGAGIMGRPMAAHLFDAGFGLVVPERANAGTAALLAAGARAVTTNRDVAANADVVFTMLPDTAAVEAAVYGDDGVLAGLRPGSLFIDMSSIAPATARRIAVDVRAAGSEALDAPVSGGEQGAIEATLSIMAGGAPHAFARALPLFDVLGTLAVHVGEAGAGQVSKACNQLVVAVVIEAVAEALALAEASGADPAAVRTALAGGLGASRILDRYGPRMLESNYVPGARAKLHHKDLTIATALAAESGIALPALALLLERFTELIARTPDLDHSALRTLITIPEKP